MRLLKVPSRARATAFSILSLMYTLGFEFHSTSSSQCINIRAPTQAWKLIFPPLFPLKNHPTASLIRGSALPNKKFIHQKACMDPSLTQHTLSWATHFQKIRPWIPPPSRPNTAAPFSTEFACRNAYEKSRVDDSLQRWANAVEEYLVSLIGMLVYS